MYPQTQQRRQAQRPNGQHTHRADGAPQRTRRRQHTLCHIGEYAAHDRNGAGYRQLRHLHRRSVRGTGQHPRHTQIGGKAGNGNRQSSGYKLMDPVSQHGKPPLAQCSLGDSGGNVAVDQRQQHPANQISQQITDHQRRHLPESGGGDIASRCHGRRNRRQQELCQIPQLLNRLCPQSDHGAQVAGRQLRRGQNTAKGHIVCSRSSPAMIHSRRRSAQHRRKGQQRGVTHPVPQKREKGFPRRGGEPRKAFRNRLIVNCIFQVFRKRLQQMLWQFHRIHPGG